MSDEEKGEQPNSAHLTEETAEKKTPGKENQRVDVSDVSEFTKNFPDDPELRTLVLAFEQGRYDVVRQRAPQLIESTSNPDVARAAKELRKRLDADPLAVKILLGVMLLLALLVSWVYLIHRH